MSLVSPFETGKTKFFFKWLSIGTTQLKIDKFFLLKQSQPHYDVMQKDIENHEFFQAVNFEYIDSLKNNGTMYLVILDNSCEDICNSKAFVDTATAGRHRGLSTIYIKNNLFHQSKLGPRVDLQNIVLFKSPHNVMQVSTLSAQLGL